MDTKLDMRAAASALATAALLAAAAACSAPSSEGKSPAGGEGELGAGPYVLVLGTAQDGGLPHAACRCTRCDAARRDPERRRAIASLAVVIPATRETYLIDATPDVREQLDALPRRDPSAAGGVDRAPLSGVLLTHAHLGHYTGLSFFGFEAIHTQGLPVFCTPRMARYLRENGPWSQLVGLGNVALREVLPGAPFPLGPGVTARAVPVPHRDEFSDTVGFILEGPSRRTLYIPDTEPWERWASPVEELLQDVDLAILDGTFYSTDELPGRDVASIGHPLIASTMDRLEALVASGSTRVVFTHLNHSNPALDPGSEERKELERRGFAVLEDGDVLPL